MPSSRAWRRCSTKGTRAGPTSSSAPAAPYFLAYDDPTVPGTSNLLELPVSAALNRRVPAFVERLYARAPRPYTTKRVLRKLGVARVQWLRPSYSSVDDMCALARRMKADGVPLLNLIFHSSEAIVGGSPYNRTAQELEQFFDRLERVLAYAVNELGAIPVTFSEFRRSISDRSAIPAREGGPTHAHLPRHRAPAAGPGRERAAAPAPRAVGASRPATPRAISPTRRAPWPASRRRPSARSRRASRAGHVGRGAHEADAGPDCGSVAVVPRAGARPPRNGRRPLRAPTSCTCTATACCRRRRPCSPPGSRSPSC